jgi:hypothetical protein
MSPVAGVRAETLAREGPSRLFLIQETSAGEISWEQQSVAVFSAALEDCAFLWLEFYFGQA